MPTLPRGVSKTGKSWPLAIPTRYSVRAGQTLEDLAKKAGSDWKTVAKTNNLKPPYALREGSTVLLPRHVASAEPAAGIFDEGKEEKPSKKQAATPKKKTTKKSRTKKHTSSNDGYAKQLQDSLKKSKKRRKK